MKSLFLVPIAAAAVSLTLSFCQPSVESLRHIDFSEEHFGYFGDNWNEEARSVVAHYLQTGEVNYASPEHKLTLLHIAAVTHRLWLVEKLLAEGADPNVRMLRPDGNGGWLPGATPAVAAVRAAEDLVNADALLIVRALVEKGADINLTGQEDEGILSACYTGYRYKRFNGRGNREISTEELMLELMKLGAKADVHAARNCIPACREALKAMLTSPEGKDITPHMPDLLDECARTFEGNATVLLCAEVLLAHTESVNGRSSCGQHLPLFTLAQNYAEFMEDKAQATCKTSGGLYADFFSALLAKGADPLLPDGQYGETCAADVLAVYPQMLEELRKRGYGISAPAHHFTAEKLIHQLLDIPTAAVRAEEAAAQGELISSLLLAQPEGSEAKEYRKACAKALALLHRTDATRTQELILAHPALHDAAAWQGDAAAARGLLTALQENTHIILPQEQLLQAARGLEQAGQPAAAHAFIRLLSRDASAAELIEQLCTESTALPLRAAAWSCKVEQEGLQSLGNITEKWYAESNVIHNDGYAVRRRACEVEHTNRSLGINPTPYEAPERLFYVKEGAEERQSRPADEGQQEWIDSLRRLGAPLAARLCGDKEAPDAAPDVKTFAARYGVEAAASLELEIALAQYLHKHNYCFEKPGEDAEEE